MTMCQSLYTTIYFHFLFIQTIVIINTIKTVNKTKRASLPYIQIWPDGLLTNDLEQYRYLYSPYIDTYSGLHKATRCQTLIDIMFSNIVIAAWHPTINSRI